jgi:hypothetical protein
MLLILLLHYMCACAHTHSLLTHSLSHSLVSSALKLYNYKKFYLYQVLFYPYLVFNVYLVLYICSLIFKKLLTYRSLYLSVIRMTVLVEICNYNVVFFQFLFMLCKLIDIRLKCCMQMVSSYRSNKPSNYLF